MLDGEELIGAKQNRVLNLTILAGARSSLIIPVSCVEAGRWNMQSQHFSSAAHMQFASGRASRIARGASGLARAVQSEERKREERGCSWVYPSSRSLSILLFPGSCAILLFAVGG
jgi:hypothetical protein